MKRGGDAEFAKERFILTVVLSVAVLLILLGYWVITK
jgi:hypothetical protein